MIWLHSLCRQADGCCDLFKVLLRLQPRCRSPLGLRGIRSEDSDGLLQSASSLELSLLVLLALHQTRFRRRRIDQRDRLPGIYIGLEVVPF